MGLTGCLAWFRKMHLVLPQSCQCSFHQQVYTQDIHCKLYYTCCIECVYRGKEGGREGGREGGMYNGYCYSSVAINVHVHVHVHY